MVNADFLLHNFKMATELSHLDCDVPLNLGSLLSLLFFFFFLLRFEISPLLHFISFILIFCTFPILHPVSFSMHVHEPSSRHREWP